MKEIELYINVFHFGLYKIFNKIHFVFNKINPIRLFLNLPFFRSFYEKKNIDLNSLIDDLYQDKKNGLNIIYSSVLTMFFVTIFFFSISISLNNILQNEKNLPSYIFFIIMGFSWIIDYVFISKNDNYLNYFKKFNKEKKQKRYVYIAILSCFFILLFFVVSLNNI